MSVVAIIPARSGSKRIKKKNLINFHEKPMIQWTIEAALRSNVFSDIFVSTDDIEIARISEKCGVEVPFLRDDFCDDVSPVSVATIHTLKQIDMRLGKSFSHVVQLMPNCPLRNEKQINLAWKYYNENDHDFQISAFKFGWMNPWWAATLSKSGEPTKLFPDMEHTRSQDLSDLYCPSGAIWIANTSLLFEQGTFYGAGHRFHEMDWKHGVDIDTFEDLEFAEAIHNIINRI